MKFSSACQTGGSLGLLERGFECVDQMPYGSLFQVTGSAYEKDLWLKVFVLYTKNALVTGQTELSRWCVYLLGIGQVFRTKIWQGTITGWWYLVLYSSSHWQPVKWVHIAANPPGFPGNLPDFETCPGIPDLKNNSRILKFVKKQNKQKLGSFLRLCQGLW